MKSLNQRLGNVARGLALLVVVLVSLASPVVAQDPSEIAALYGRGVHAFFAGQATKAEKIFTECAMAGSTDPRVYYFRGVARLRQGRQYEAEEDFQIAATYEARDPGRRYAISNALQRIQGPERITLEEFRRQGRVDKVQQRRGQVRARYENLRNREAEVLHQSDPVPLEHLSQPSVEVRRGGQGAVTTPTPVAQTPTPQPVIDPTPADVVDPAPVDSVPAPAASEATDNLFDTEPAAEAPDADENKSQLDDLFGEESATDTAPAIGVAPVVEPATEVPAPEGAIESDDPFGGTTEAAPAVTTPPEAEPAAAVPAAERAAETTTDDPFGGATEEAPITEPSTPPAAAEASDETAEETPDDPFGETAPATEPAAEETTEEAPATDEAADDPFGGTTEEAPATEPAAETAEEAAEEPTEDTAATDDPFGETETADTEAEEADGAAEDAENEEAATEDPFGDTTEESTEDPFGESEPAEGETDSAEGETTEEGESAETGDTAEEDETESTEDAPADEAAEDDPFGGF